MGDLIKKASANSESKIPFLSYNESDFNTESEELQRTEAWFEARTGMFTGSGIAKLMTCDRSGAKLQWDDKQKVLSFGETAKKEIARVAFERKYGYSVRSGEDIKQFRYGKKCEPFIFDMIDQSPEPCDFMVIIDGLLGASPDGINPLTEIKACMKWETLFERQDKDYDQGHKDFWQTQTEMLAADVKEMIYVLATPDKFPDKVVYEGKDFEGKIASVKIIEASEVHQNAIRERCLVADSIIKHWINNNEWIYDDLR